MDGEDLGNLIGAKIDFDSVLANHPTIARHVEQENVVKDKVLEEYKGLHPHLFNMLQMLLWPSYWGVC